MDEMSTHISGNAKRILRPILKLDTYARLAEELLLLKEYESSAKQLFILGLPRSGTTLIYQYIAHRLNVAYFTNGVGNFPHAPSICTFVEHNLYSQYISDFRSSYGKVVGHVAPREAGSFWLRFFDIDNYARYSELSGKDRHSIRNTIAFVSNVFGDAPFVNKNVKHLLRIDALGHLFPESIFLVVERALVDVAISVLRGRYKNLKDPNHWWSVKPPDYEVIKALPIIEQIANQCVSLKTKMEKDFSEISPDRVIRIPYSDFCSSPERIVTKLGTVLDTGRTDNPIENHFTFQQNRAQSEEDSVLIDLVHSLSGTTK